MKKITIIILVLVATVSLFAQDSVSNLDNKINEKIKAKTIENAQVGDLICLDEFGNYILSSGSEFEKILGFTTSAPYVTPNKPKDPKGSKVDFKGIVSLENGAIKKGDYLCPSKKYPGKVMKCSKEDFPYAVADEDANTDFALIKVKVLGYRR